MTVYILSVLSKNSFEIKCDIKIWGKHRFKLQ